MADQDTCQRCDLQTLDLRSIYMGLARKTEGVNVLPVNPFGMAGGTLEICGHCHAQWLAAIKTWFENPTDL